MLTTLKNGYYVGIDAGGSKTEAVIAKESGFVLGHGKGPGANPHNMPVEEAYAHIAEAVQQAIQQVKDKHQLDIHHIEATCLGLAGLDTDKDRQDFYTFLHQLAPDKRLFSTKEMIVVKDALVGFKSGSDKPYGVCLISGTGSNCYGVSLSGKEATAGDWGYILGDQGSAFAMGQALLRQVMREYDGRRQTTNVTRKVLDFLQLKDASELVSWTYQNKNLVKSIAKLSQLINDVDLSNSKEVLGVMTITVRELIEAYEAVNRRLDFPTDRVLPIVLVGGMFSVKGQFTNQVMQSILKKTPNARIVFPTKSPAEGALKIALSQGQVEQLPHLTMKLVNHIIGNLE